MYTPGEKCAQNADLVRISQNFWVVWDVILWWVGLMVFGMGELVLLCGF